MAEERRREISREIILAIQDAVTKAFDENAHRCLVGFTPNDKQGLLDLKNLLDDYPAHNLRDSFQLMKTLVRARNVAGNVFMTIVFGGSFLWALNKLFPGVWKQ